MEPVGAVLEQLKAFAKSGQDFFDGVLRRRNPIEILKRLQREAFSDIMKLRDRQEKVERLLSFYQSSKSGPFQEDTTHVRGQVDCLGALLVLGNLNKQYLDAVDRSGIRTGIDSRFIFETTIRQKDTLAAELVTTQRGKDQTPLFLSKLNYTANVNDSLSFTVVPMGAQCRDVAIASNSFDQMGKGLTDLPSFRPPLLNLHNGSAVGVTLRKSNVITSFAQFVAGLGMLSAPDTMWNRTSTFGQLVYQFPGGTKLSVLGLHHLPLSLRYHKGFGALTIPIVLSKQHEPSEPVHEELECRKSLASVALMVESELDNFTKIGGWIEIDKFNPKSVQWAVNVSDVSEDSFGWGLSLSGMNGGSESRDHFQVESYLKFNMGNKFCLKPGLALAKDGNSKIAALMLRSNWSL